MLISEMGADEHILGLGRLPGNRVSPNFEMYGLDDIGITGVIEWLKNPGNLILVGAGVALILYVVNRD